MVVPLPTQSRLVGQMQNPVLLLLLFLLLSSTFPTESFPQPCVFCLNKVNELTWNRTKGIKTKSWALPPTLCTHGFH